MRLAWPTNEPGFVIEGAIDPASTNWVTVNAAVAIANGRYQTTLPADLPARYFRLKRP